MHRTTRLKVTDINQHFVCVLCDGYLIDATTIVECLHSFCRTCIVRYLENSRFCPVCDVQVHETKPLLSIRSDTTLQDVVYKLIPGLYQNEMQRRREFYSEHPEEAAKCSTEERGEGTEQRCFYSPKENISLMLEYFQGSENNEVSDAESGSDTNSKELMTRYLNCPAALTVSNLKKFIRMKFSLPQTYRVEIMYNDHLLIDDYTLMDIAYIYSWRRAGPMKFLYTFSHRKYLPKRVLEPIEPTETPTQLPDDTEVPAAPTEQPDDVQMAEAPSEQPDDTEATPSQQKVENVEIENVASEPVAVAAADASVKNEPVVAAANAMDETDSSNSEHPSIAPIEPEKMETAETSDSSSAKNIAITPNCSPSTKVEATYTPQNTVLPTANGIRIKLIHCPDPGPKARKKSTGRKGGRTRYKSTPVQRFPRLAPYPPPHSTAPAACLPTPNMSPLSQITVGKLVPSVMTTLAPNIVTALVSTTANTMCNVTKNSTMLPTATFLGQPPLCTHPSNFATAPNCIPVSSSAVSTALPSVSATGGGLKSILPHPAGGSTVSTSEPVASVPAATTVQLSSTDSRTVSSHQTFTLPSTTTVSSSSLPPIPTASEISVSKEQPPVTVPITIQSSSPAVTIAPMPPKPVEKPAPETIAPKEVETPSILKSALCDDHLRTSRTSSPLTPSNGTTDVKMECNGIKSSPSLSPVKESMFCDTFSPEKKASKAFETSIKNSISAEFSDNDDLGCQPDLVVDEQKMDSSDNEDDTDAALRKKITAIAEKDDEADATDDTEADSGRASDISSQARSSCDDDIGSPMNTPMNTVAVSETVTSTTSSRLPAFTLSVSSSSLAPVTSDTVTSSSNNRNMKSNNINLVINNILRNHEKKDTIGALDLSTCTKKPGEAAAAASRQKPVANPVLDIKHRQQTYLPAPNNKQHTACVPSPKHPTSSPILMHGLTAHHHSLMQPQMPTVNRKSPHLPIPLFHSAQMVYPSHTRGISSPSCVPGRSTPTYTSHARSPPVPSAHQGLPPMLPGILPCLGKSVMNSFPIRSAAPSSPSAMPARNNSSPGNHLKVSDGKLHYPKGPVSRSPVSTPKTMVPTTNSSSPSPTTSSHKSNHSTIPSYKKLKSYKSYNHNFKSSSNLQVINPDTNGYQHKLVIRNLDVRPNNSHQSHKL